jgi:hypothetical protein
MFFIGDNHSWSGNSRVNLLHPKLDRSKPIQYNSGPFKSPEIDADG